MKRVSIGEFTAIRAESSDLIVIDLRADAKRVPFPVPNVSVIPVAENELTGVLEGLPADRSVAFCGASDLSIFLITTSHCMEGSAPFYVLEGDLSLAEVSHHDAANALGVNVCTIKSRIFHGKKCWGVHYAAQGLMRWDLALVRADSLAIQVWREAARVYELGIKPELNVKAVVYATDFSPCSENAGTYAGLVAQHFHAALLVTHAFFLSQAAMELELDRKMESQQRIGLQNLLAARARALSSDSIQALPSLLDGDPHKAVSEFAEKHAPALIVLGTHGGGRVERGLIGSVAETILRSTRWPCLTVGPLVPTLSSSCELLPFRRILAATDFSPQAAGAITFALSLARSRGAEVDVLNVVPERAIEHPERLSEILNHFYEALDEFVPQRAREFSNPRTFVETGCAHDRILEHVRNRSVDLLVLGIRKTSHLGLEMRTSGAFRLIVDAPCPVLTITS
jgi:nucleotide-binding universal stress UspA family protein